MNPFIINILLLLPVVTLSQKFNFHPDLFLTLEERVIRHGYPIEVHQVITDDGYILSLYRIPYGLEKTNETGKSVVFLMYGMGATPIYWIILGAKNSLPYYLADRGFDVWILTSRGSRGSTEKNHLKWDWNKDNEYWLFSIHELALHDLTAQTDYITKYTNQAKAFFIGHSAGAPEFLVLLSEKPEYNKKFKMALFFASSPIIRRMDYPLALLLTSITNIWRGLSKYFNITEFFPQLGILQPVFLRMCADKQFIKVCMAVSGVVGSHISTLMDQDLIGLIASEQPQRLSFQQLMHFADNVNGGDFRKYDYGPKKNMRIYGEKIPPKYNLHNCKVPVGFFYSPRDSICGKWDVYDSMNLLPNVVVDYEVPHDEFTHTDFLFARNAPELVYEKACKLFKDFDEGVVPPAIGFKIIPEENGPIVI